MKQTELKPCTLCGQGVMHSGLPLFYRVTVQRFGVNVAAVQQQIGLEMMLGGNALLANVMGTDADMATPIGEETVLMVCETCAMQETRVAVLAES